MEVGTADTHSQTHTMMETHKPKEKRKGRNRDVGLSVMDDKLGGGEIGKKECMKDSQEVVKGK